MNSFETMAAERGFRNIAGVDEVGRGPLAGPLVAAAVIFPRGYDHPQINDSKKLSAVKRKRLHSVILQDAIAVGFGVVEPRLIDEINIHQATILAMKEAVTSLTLQPDYLLIDGLHRLDLPIYQRTVVRGDSLSISIAAASIIAKVSRDLIMETYHCQHPQYNFAKNKGYGTREHQEAIRNYGQCEIHRRSFILRSNDYCGSLELFEP